MAPDDPATLPLPVIADPEEYEAALDLLFSHCEPRQRRVRRTNAIRLIHQGDLSPEGLLVLRERGSVTGVIACGPMPGAASVLWPPRSVPDHLGEQREDLLIRHAASWLRGQGACLSQCLLSPEEAGLAGSLLRNGFRHITRLEYMRHDLRMPSRGLDLPSRLEITCYGPGSAEPFHQTLLSSYEDTLDCPELNGVRAIEEIVAGHQSQGRFDPRLWWLALDRGTPVGVLLLADLPEEHTWEIAYLGIVPGQRQRGHGRELLLRALCEARAEQVRHLTLSVDARNHPAQGLYSSLGFETYDSREVCLAIWR